MVLTIEEDDLSTSSSNSRSSNEETEDNRAHAHSKSAIQSGYGLVSAHILINTERRLHQKRPLQRSPQLDALAKKHAAFLAEQEDVVMLNFEQVDADNLPAQVDLKKTGQNISCGSCIHDLHKNGMRQQASYKQTVLAKRYTQLGVATAKGKDTDQLYMVQLFAATTLDKGDDENDNNDSDDDDSSIEESQNGTLEAASAPCSPMRAMPRLTRDCASLSPRKKKINTLTTTTTASKLGTSSRTAATEEDVSSNPGSPQNSPQNVQHKRRFPLPLFRH